MSESDGTGSGNGKRRWRSRLFMAVALIALGAGGMYFLLDDDGDTVSSGPTTTAAANGTSTSGPSTTRAGSTTTATEGDDDAFASAVWPAHDGSTKISDPVKAAELFGTGFLGFRSPLVGQFKQGDSRSGEVDLRPRANGPITTVLVRQLGPDDAWFVLGAQSANIAVDTPAADVQISSPVTVKGRAHAFEGNVNVEVRDGADRPAIGDGFVTGGGDMMRPFEGSIKFTAPTKRYGAVVFLTRSAENGEVWEATVVRVRFGRN